MLPKQQSYWLVCANIKSMNYTKLPVEKIFNLADFIVAKDGLVISKNVCDIAAFNMTLYSFGAGEGITWQTIPGDLLLSVVEGQALLETDDEGTDDGETGNLGGTAKKQIAGKGMVLFVEGGRRFQISGNKPYKLNFAVVNKIKNPEKGENLMFIKNFDQGKVVTLKDQVAVESGTIVSKTLVNGDALTMTLFAFDVGQGVSTHSAPGDAFVVCLEGEAEIELNGEKLLIHEGESLIMPAGAPHALKAVQQYKMLLTVVKA